MKTPSKQAILFALALVCLPAARAQYNSPTAQDARSGALGGSLFIDTAVRGVTLDYRCGYLMTELADKSLRLQLPTGASGMALAAYSHHGDATWNEQQLALGYGMRVTSWLRLGVGARWLYRGIGDAHYESHQWVAPSLLVQGKWPRTTLTLLAGTRPWDGQQPWRLHLQAAYRALPQLLTLVEVEQEDRLRLRLGMEYVYAKWCFLRVGMATRPLVCTAGLGVRMRHYSIDLAIGVHDALGITPQTSLSLWF